MDSSAMKTLRLVGLILLCLGLTLKAGILQAQTSFGTIIGTVTDPSQAGIPDAAITVTNPDTGVARHATTDQYGNYTVGSLLPGVYTVKAEHAGFQVVEVSKLVLPVAQTVTVNLVMQVGTVTQTVQVTAEAPLLTTADATVGTVVNNTSVVTLPLNGRNFTELILLVPGSVPQGATFMVAGGRNFSVSGNRFEQNNFTLDGVYNNETFFKQFAIQPSIDAIQEFKVQTNMADAEYGEAAGANVNVALKSGTNLVHGSVFEFLRNDVFDANDFFRNKRNLGKPPFKRNQFGFVVGGPVYIPGKYDGRNKTFWLFNYEAIRVRRGSTAIGTIPTATQFAGDLRDQAPIFDPATTRVDPATGKLVRDRMQCDGALNVICPNRIDPFVKAYIDVFYPKVTQGGAGNIVNPNPFQQNQYQWTLRVDQKIRENLQFFSRFSLVNASQVTPQALPILTNSLGNRFRNAVASWTYLKSATTVMDFKLGFHRSNLQIADSNPAPGVVAFLGAHPLQGTPVKSTRVPLYPPLSIAGFNSPGQSGFPFPSNIFQVLFRISQIRGRHSLKAGFDINHLNNLDDGLFTSQFDFSSVPTADPQNVTNTGSAIASYLLGLPSVGRRNLGDTAAYMRATNTQLYVQDDIKATSKLSFNLGVRYEYNQWPVEKFNHLSMFDRTSNQYVWAGRNPLTGQGPNVRRSVIDPDWNNFAPRIGLAYRVKPNTTIRAGYGIFYVSNWLWEVQGVRGSWPYAISETLSAQNTGFPTKPIETFFSPDLTPGPNTPPSSQHTLGRLDRTSYMQQWNLGVQRELARDLLLEVDYVGNKGTKLAVFLDGNDPPPGPGVVGSPGHPRPFPQAGAFSEITNLATSNYSALQVKLEKRFSNGLQFLTSYAWGHYLDVGGSGFSQGSAVQDIRHINADRADGTFDFRHIFTASYVYDLPFGKGKRWLAGASGLVDQLVGGWEITGITHYNTGGPVNVSLPFDNANIGPRSAQERPNRILGQPAKIISPNDRTQGWLNPAAFQVPAKFTFGTLGRNTERGPGFGNWDFGVFKNFPFHEGSQVVQFRAEFFNLFNHVNLGNPNGSLGTLNFGKIFGVQNASRDIQFALKFIF